MNSYLHEYSARAYLNNYYWMYARIARSALAFQMAGKAFCTTYDVADSRK